MGIPRGMPICRGRPGVKRSMCEKADRYSPGMPPGIWLVRKALLLLTGTLVSGDFQFWVSGSWNNKKCTALSTFDNKFKPLLRCRDKDKRMLGWALSNSLLGKAGKVMVQPSLWEARPGPGPTGLYNPLSEHKIPIFRSDCLYRLDW